MLCHSEILDFMERENSEIDNDTGQLLKFCCIAISVKEAGEMSLKLEKKTDSFKQSNSEETTPSL
jgi:hypothetical protein